MAHLPKRWDSIVRTHLDAPIDEHFGQPITITPMVATANGRRTVDPERKITRCTGVFTNRPHRPGMAIGNRPVGKHSKNDLHSIEDGTLPKLSVSDSAFAPGARPKQGDQVEIAGERYEVVSAPHNGTSRFILQLVAIGGAT